MTRDDVLTEIVRVRDDIWGPSPREISLSGLRAMVLRLADTAIYQGGTNPTPAINPHATAELAALCLMVLEGWQ